MAVSTQEQQFTLIRERYDIDEQAVMAIMRRHLSSDVPLIQTINQHIIDSGGKRLRPLLVLIVGHALGTCVEEHHTLAAIIEFVHTATLLHDDVVDGSTLRRGKQTANAVWGNAPSVLVGDYLYSRAFQMMVSLNRMEILGSLARATNEISEGEVQQLLNCGNVELSETDYLKVIERKTATLFAAACETSAILAGATPTQVQAMHDYGLHLGLAFQLIDDALDYAASSDEMGKNTGDDLAEGKVTLPLLYALKHSDAQTRALICDAIKQGSLEHWPAILDAIKQTQAIDYTHQCAEQAVAKAVSALATLSDTQHKQSLVALTEFCLSRRG